MPPTFPYPALRELPTPILRTTYEWECIDSLSPFAPGSRDWTLICAVQWDIGDRRSVTKVRVRWNSADICGTVRGEQKVVVLPGGSGSDNNNNNNNNNDNDHAKDKDKNEKLSDAQLQLAARRYGPHIVSYCRERVGKREGDGECWTLAAHALKAAGRAAEMAGYEAPMQSVGRSHGVCVLEWEAGGGMPVEGILGLAGVAAGDVLEVEDGHFRTVREVLGGLGRGGEENVRAYRHTAVVVGVGKGEVVEVVEQNAKVKGVVVEGEYDLRELVEGIVKVYRPVGRSQMVEGLERGGGVDVGLEGVCSSW
ncbi:hypothetical protein EMCG_00480 [[Emmonsia] crescens]|uniref:BBC1/AIM3 cysteine proteinase-fold domain-containing protein n=1 Tax=[Emmonsia] crescens TaxID=73230 RepID=A0A0G2HV39_9EURO|nr:hypothetical protein EMCG_00480 [Emmonsia crescens UAMH 3008]